MSGAVVMELEQDAGKLVAREVHFTVDVRPYADRAVYPWLVMAANPHLSAPDISRVLYMTGGLKCYRSAGWIRKRRWMTDGAETRSAGSPGRRANADGRDEQAERIVAENRELSSRGLVRLLREHGISRNRNWVLRRRDCHTISDR